MSGGVRNLRAMFENKDVSASPPADRGRSPAGSIGPGSNGTSPRPLSKVRTSFVAVERSGQLGSQMGLKRENSGEPSMARRRTSFSINEEEHPKTTAERKQSIASEFEARKNNTTIGETIPEVAVETPLIEFDKQLGGDVKAIKTPSGGWDLKKAAASKAASDGHMNGSKSATIEKTVDQPSSKLATRPTPISTAKTTIASKPSPNIIKSPATPKRPKTPTTPRGRPKEPVKQPEQKHKKKEAVSAASKPASKPAPSTTSAASSKTRIPPSPPQTGFVKPKPRSPTRPVKLPASLMAHTASSGSKGAAAPANPTRRSLSRASGNSQATKQLQTHPTLSRSPSRFSAATGPKSLTRKPSTLDKTHSRPSLGPPPSHLKKQPSRQSLPPAPADEGFLARMMRPTTSSASKTAEKTPPKRAPSVKRPVTRDGLPKHEVQKAAVPKMGELVSNPVANEQTPTTSSAPEEIKEESKPALVEESESEGPKAPDTKENVSLATEIEDNDPEEPEVAEAEDSPEVKPLPAVLETVLEIESTPEKPAPIEDLLAASQKPVEKEETRAVTEEPVVPGIETEESEKTEDIEAAKEAIAESKSEPEPVPVKTVEVEIPKEVEAAEDPEDVKAREEIAKLNADLLKASAEDDDVE